jgi:hypothetical protein
MNEWSVRLVVAVVVAATDAETEHLYDSLSNLHVALGQDKNRHLEVQLTITGATLLDAFAEANRTVTDALNDAGLRNPEIIEVEAMSWDEFDRRLDQPQVPELWSVTEAAQHLGVSNQRINQLVTAYPDALPAVVKLAGDRGPRLWLADTWRRFATTKRHTGRPAGAAKASKKRPASNKKHHTTDETVPA